MLLWPNTPTQLVPLVHWVQGFGVSPCRFFGYYLYFFGILGKNFFGSWMRVRILLVDFVLLVVVMTHWMRILLVVVFVLLVVVMTHWLRILLVVVVFVLVYSHIAVSIL